MIDLSGCETRWVRLGMGMVSAFLEWGNDRAGGDEYIAEAHKGGIEFIRGQGANSIPPK
jgi:hypothetical protein